MAVSQYIINIMIRTRVLFCFGMDIYIYNYLLYLYIPVLLQWH